MRDGLELDSVEKVKDGLFIPFSSPLPVKGQKPSNPFLGKSFKTSKSVTLKADLPATATEILPVVALEGTVTVSSVADAVVTVA